jgi:predicted transposase YdaD
MIIIFLRQAVIELRENETLQELEPLLSFFASFVLDLPIVQQIMRWDMTVLRESPWYQEILKEGLQQESLTLVSKLIEHRFGIISLELNRKIEQLSVVQLEDLAIELLEITELSQLEIWLAQNLN